MRRDRAYRLWTTLAGIAACASGVWLWHVGERFVGGLGVATALFHALWAIDLRRWAHLRVRRRPIVIPRLRHRTDRARHG